MIAKDIEITDFLVIGTGIAGLSYALDVAEHGSVTIVCKKTAFETNTRYAQGGIASVSSKSDSFASHIQDTLSAGCGLCNEDIVNFVVSNAPKHIDRLVERGVNFDKLPGGLGYKLGMEGGHSERRILHSADTTGAEIHRALYKKTSQHKNINIVDSQTAIDIIKQENKVRGVYSYDSDRNSIRTFSTKCLVLATGGIGKVYLYTSNSDVATGDGIAMAYRAGCEIANMEFIQFHPTCLYHPKAKSFLISEALRGEGAVLLNAKGERFLSNYHEKKELAPRDVVARAIDTEMKRTGEECVFLDISFQNPDFISSRFPNIYEICKEFGYNITKEAIPVVPAEHYSSGGIKTDINAKTNLNGLYAIGETACTGLHGANRLASNGLLEALIFSHQAAKHSLNYIENASLSNALPPWDHMDTTLSTENVIVSYIWDEVRRMMWDLVGIVRSDKRLKLAQRRIQHIEEEVNDYYWNYRISEDLIELRNIVLVAKLIIQSATQRRESRGLHYNLDYPTLDSNSV